MGMRTGSSLSRAAEADAVFLVDPTGAVLGPNNPLPNGGVYNAVPAVLSGGSSALLQLGTRGSLKVQLMDADGLNAMAVAGSNNTVMSSATQAMATINFMWGYDPGPQNFRKVGIEVRGSDYGALLVQPFALPSSRWTYQSPTGGLITNAEVTVMSAAGVGVRNYVTGMDLKNRHATVETEFEVRDGSLGPVLWRGALPAAMLTADTLRFDVPLKGTANTALVIICITTGAKVYPNIQGYQAA